MNRAYERRKNKIIPVLTNQCNHTFSKYSFPETYIHPGYPLWLTYGFFAWFSCIIFPCFHHTGSVSLSKPNATYSLSATSRNDFFYFHVKMGDCLGSQYLICLSVSQESQDPCAQPARQHPIRVTLPWTVSLNQRAVGLTCSRTHIRKPFSGSSCFMTHQWVFPLYSRMLPAHSSCHCLWRTHTNNLTLY